MPKYNIGQVVYLRESAGVGFIEAVQISGMQLGPSGEWIYTIAARVGQPLSPAIRGDKNTIVNGAILYYTESELVDECTALEIAEANAKSVYEKIKARRLAICSTDVTGE